MSETLYTVVGREIRMDNPLARIAKQQGWPQGSIIRPGPGFRIGRPETSLATTDQGDQATTLTADDQPLEITSTYRVAGNTIVVSRSLTNTGAERSEPIHLIEPLYLVFDNPSEQWRHIYANGGTTEAYYPPTAFRTHEQTRSTKQSSQSRAHPPFTIESHPAGRSSNLHLPFLVSLTSTDEDSDGLFIAMEWSGGWYISVERTGAGRTSLAAGMKVNGLCLEPGETLDLPPVHLGFFTGGPAAATNSLRRYLYQQVCPELEGRAVLPPASYDHYYGIESAIDYELLSREADRAAELGLEIFVVDAGWFKGGFPNGAGNWDEVDATKLPNGLEPLADYVRELGMGFGLWFEPERAVEGTNIIRDHPEWFVPVEQPYYEPQNYNINLAIPGAQDYLIEMIGGWVERLGLRWIRWDYNIDPLPLWEAIDPSGKAEHEFMAGLYRVLDKLMQDHPSLLIESCSSGGRRVDIGTMRRAHTYWFSDQTEDPLVCRYMQARANRFLPGHLLNSAVTVNRDQGDDGFDDTAVLSRMLGALAFNGDIASWSPDLTSRMRGWVDKFKGIRHLLVQDFYQLLPIPTTIDDWDAVQFVSYSRDESVLFVFAGQKGGQMNILPLGLRDERRYRITRQPAGTPRTFSGSEVMAEGLQVRLGSHEGGLWHIVLDDPAGPR